MEENKGSDSQVSVPSGSEVKAEEDIDHLLDSALEDMSAPKTVSAKPDEAQAEVGGPAWSEEFVKNAASQFEEMLRACMAGAATDKPAEQLDPAVNQFANIAMRLGEACLAGQLSQAQEPDATSSESPAAQEDPLADTIRQLSQGAQALKDVSDEDMLSKMLSDLGFGPNADPAQAGSGLLGGLESVLPMMETMMKGLVSKDVLYPPLKELCEKYPAWLEQNKDSTPAESYANYEKQFDLMSKVCEEFDSELETDSEERKNERFIKIMELMQAIQLCGPPPMELVGETGAQGEAPPEVTFDPNQASPEQCCIM